MKSFTIAMLATLGSSTMVHAQTPGPNLIGFQCYKVDQKGLHITPDDAFAGRGFPHAFTEPSTASKKIGITSEIVYVARPLIKQNGFLQILRHDGQMAWVAETTLVPLRKADGTVGGCTLSRQPNGLIGAKLDPGVAVRY